MVNSKKFLSAFAEVWRERRDNAAEQQRIRDTYPFNREWTTYMLYGEDAFLQQLADRLARLDDLADLRLSQQPIYTVDAILYSHCPEGTLDLARRKHNGYPAKLYALIEHENGGAVEEEMWKLLWWRCPLKVIVFYDWMESERRGRRESWLTEKVAHLNEMRSRVDVFHPEDAETEYLLIVGDRTDDSALPRWRYTRLPETHLTEFA